jgi:hypothetical protein
MFDCKHTGMVTKNQFVHFCSECGSTINQVNGAIRNLHGKIVGNISTPDWKPLDEGDSVVYVGEHYADMHGRVGKIFELPHLPEGSVTVRYGPENSDGEYHCFSLTDLKPAEDSVPKQRPEPVLGSAPKHTWSAREAIKEGATTLEEAAQLSGLPTEALRPAYDYCVAHPLNSEPETRRASQLLLETIRLVEKEIEDAREALDGTWDLEKIETNLRTLLRIEKADEEPYHESVLYKVFVRLNILARGELKAAKELLTMVKKMAPYSRIDRDLDSLAGLARKAALRQKVGHAYLWAIQDLKTVLDLPIDEAEFSEAIKNHPTERN